MTARILATLLLVPLAGTTTSTAGQRQACAFLPTALISSEGGVAEADLRPESNDERYCGFKWDKANMAEIEAENRDAMMKRMEAMARDRTAPPPPLVRKATEHSVHLSLAPPFSSEANATAGFAGLRRRLAAGITVETTDETRTRASRGNAAASSALPDAVTFQADTDSVVAGVGDEAFWSSSLSQISVRKGASIFHVGARVADEPSANFEIARKLALQIAEKMSRQTGP